MRKLLMTIGAAALLAGSAQAADNYTCATPPSCATLGYTLTSTTNCVGTVLKCPFDTSRYYCTQKAEVLKNMALNWNDKRSFNQNQNFYAPNYGYIVVVVRDTGGGAVALTINDIYYQGSGHSQGTQFYALPVTPNDKIYVTGSGASENRLYFVPFVGN